MKSTVTHGVRMRALLGILLAFLAADISAQLPDDSQRIDSFEAAERRPVAGLLSRAPESSEEAGLFDRDVVFQAHRLRGLRAEVASLLISKDRGGPIALAVFAVPSPARDGDSEIALFVEVDGNSFLQNNQREVARVEIYAYVLSDSDSVVAFKAEAIQVDVGSYGEAIWQSGLKFYGQLGVSAGTYTVRVMIRNYHSKAFGIRSTQVTVPGADPGDVSVLAALFEEPTQRDLWLPIRQWFAPGEQSPPVPFFVGGSALSPAAYPVMVASSSERAFLFGLKEVLAAPSGRFQVLASRESEEVLAEAEFVAELEVSRSPEGRSVLRTQFKIPDLPSGEYAARFAVVEPNGNVEYSTPQSIFILAENPQSRKLLWPDLRWLARGAVPTENEQPRIRKDSSKQAGKPTSKRRLRQLKEDYREALSKLASGSEMEGRSAVFELESETMRQGFGAVLESLQRAEIEVGQELGEKSRESLVPIIVLHGELYQAYRGRRLYALLSHTRTVIESMCEVYIRAGGSRNLVAESLASLGGYLQQASLFSSSQRLFLAALEHEPDNVTALLGMAAGLERHARYAEAISYLNQLVLVRESFSEGMLRLAINFGRSGAFSEAKRLLSEAKAPAAPSWVRCIAYQELARIFLTVGDLSQAAEILEEAVVEDPQEQSTYLLLAHVYDRLKEPRRAAQLLSELVSQPGKHFTSARKTYDSWPEAPMEQARMRLSLEAKDRLQALLEALDDAGDSKG